MVRRPIAQGPPPPAVCKQEIPMGWLLRRIRQQLDEGWRKIFWSGSSSSYTAVLRPELLLRMRALSAVCHLHHTETAAQHRLLACQGVRRVPQYCLFFFTQSTLCLPAAQCPPPPFLGPACDPRALTTCQSLRAAWTTARCSWETAPPTVLTPPPQPWPFDPGFSYASVFCGSIGGL